tara:strand:- start:8 stop:184 length:177 start_codon:yes stop_codon:yes gene_type:complete
MKNNKLTSDLMRYYEVDINNCRMSHKQWIKQIVKALTDKEYLNKFNTELNLYNESINQ